MIDHIDAENRRIYLDSSTVDNSIHPIDLYKEMRQMRKDDETLRGYDVFLKAYGNVPKGGGKSTERYVVCVAGTKIVPYDTSHVITVTGTIITDDGYEGVYCFDRGDLNVDVYVDINYVPPQVEIVTVNVSGGSGLTQSEHNKLMTLENGLTQADKDTLATKTDVYAASLL